MIETKYLVMIENLYLYQVIGDTEIRAGYDTALAKVYDSCEAAKNIADFFGGRVIVVD